MLPQKNFNIIPYLYTFTITMVMTIILFCVIVAASFISMITSFICECFCWQFSQSCDLRDLELGTTDQHHHRGGSSSSSRRMMMMTTTTYQTLEVSENYQLSCIAERRQQRQQALEELLPQVKYGSSSSEEEKTLMMPKFGDCSICLDDYEDGEFCRVFPVCKHMFHVKCIDQWLINHLTCPVCRKCLLDS